MVGVLKSSLLPMIGYRTPHRNTVEPGYSMLILQFFITCSLRRYRKTHIHHVFCGPAMVTNLPFVVTSFQAKAPSEANHTLLTKTERLLKLSRLNGRITPSKPWLIAETDVKAWRLFGSVLPFRQWLNSQPNVKWSRLSGRWCNYSAVVAPAIRVTPCNASSLCETGRPWTVHHAAYKPVGT